MSRRKDPRIIELENSSSVYKPIFRWAYLGPRYWLTWIVFLLLFLLAYLPAIVRTGLAYPLAALAFWSSKKRSRIARINLQLCFPDKSTMEIEALLRMHYFIKIRVALDYGILWFCSPKRVSQLVKIENQFEYARPVANKQPVILLSCHALALDFGAAAIALEQLGVGLIKAARNKLVDWIIQRRRTRYNAVLYARDQGIRPVARAIKRGCIFYYLPDEDLGGAESNFTPFFGVLSSTLTTLGRLAKLCGATVVPVFTYFDLTRHGYVTHVLPALADFPAESRELDAHQMNKILEGLILLAPAQYMWTMKIFNRRPSGENNPYDT